MALSPVGTQGVFSPVNIAGVLFSKTDVRTPLFNMLGGVASSSREFLCSAEYTLGAASQPAISEDESQTAPAPTFDQPTQDKNVTQMFHRAVAATYRKMSDTDTLTGLNLVGQTNDVPNPLAFAIANRTAEIRNDMEFTILNGVYSLATTSAQVDKTRGLNAAIETNVVVGGDDELGGDMLIELAQGVVTGSPYGLLNVTGVLNPEQMVQLNKIILNQGQRASMSDAGSALTTYLTPFGRLNFMAHRYQPNGTAGFYNLGICRNVLQGVPGYGNFFYQKLAVVGAGESGQIFGQWGLDYGPEWMHAKITGLKQTTSATTAPQVFITNGAGSPVFTDEVS